ncbi:hypothetical protein IAQ61_000608 [Plenodomus lingam]|uniref:Atos-like conserved domain-containing protein n=1 Tax=Leptosphaeria maculans (strain JN3 / isolate v23.1.3 / race Av1-4-5-6-7-8) TaxID=985895 RepID=E5A6N3_LEPMJ|nr:hypothetical protein LEMA_P085170.1 [Plenodomus lingam JN3]KAH9880317.1 hypothetical protein IAQ61_000608 [Plenodomus lingam]CBX99278.1 hypothetical protein LEMA_P085170.1 [Plenodomus lingam JN3]
MPIFHDPHDTPSRPVNSCQAPSVGHARVGQPEYALEEQVMQTWSSEVAPVSAMPAKVDPDAAPSDVLLPSTLDRIELIDRLKRAKSPPWLQRRSEERYFDRDGRPSSRDRPRTPLANAGGSQASPTSTPEPLRDLAAAGQAIERPRSALHSGDFRAPKDSPTSGNGPSSAGSLSTSPVVPWHRSFSAAAKSAVRNEPFVFSYAPSNEARSISRARATSQCSGNSFAFLPPTSPLVQQANNTDLDPSSRPGSRQGSRSPERNNRRHTFSPKSFQDYRSTEMARSASGTPAARHLRHTNSIPYQAHQPRRSSIYSQYQPQSNPATPFLSPRRPSFSSEASPLQHAPMVGSYEESILRGRMSTTPSRPLDFVAKIGVLGKGQCKPSLKCPPHVTVPFPAVFYSYNTGNGRISDNEPSPYVGLIDLEHSLPQPTESTDTSKRPRRHHATSDLGTETADFRLQLGDELSGQSLRQEARRKEKRKRRSTSPRAPPGGSYRIPAQGQLQIVLKNPNKTAVKLFLVPYDLSDMEAGQKTFIRQRSYSAGPIIDMPTSSRKNYGTDRPEAALSNSDDPNDRPILRYLIHLHICCPSKGRYYLYKSIRVVFANRVPDGKEKLRNEIQLPEPKYSVYKPTRDVTTAHTPSSLGSQLVAEKDHRRRSAGWPLSHSQHAYDRMDGLQANTSLPPPSVHLYPLSTSASSSLGSAMPNLQPIPFSLSRLAAIESRPVSRDQMDIDPQSSFKTPVQSPRSPFGQTEGTFEKLNKGDVGYGGNAFSPVSSPSTPLSAGLLSQRLRGLDVQHVEESNPS